MSLATRIAQEFNDVRNHLPLPAAYHLLGGNLSVDATVLTPGFNTTLYTGNGGTQSINTGINMSTQWGNDTSETFGGLVWLKDRVSAGAGHVLSDTTRGINKYVQTNNTGAESSLAGYVTAFNNNGFSIGNQYNINGASHASWNFQTTHRVSGTTNHGKVYTCHYNPFTGFTIVKYEGSGIAGHEIPHHLGRKLGFFTNKCLTNATYNWVSQYRDGNYLYLNTTEKELQSPTIPTFNETNVSKGPAYEMNGSGQTYILYGWANSYFDESNKLIGNYEIGVYQGTGATGNKVKTRGKPAWVMVKRLDAVGGWWITDNKRANDGHILGAHLATVESTSTNYMDYTTDGFILQTDNADFNISGGQYLYMVAYDTNSNGGGSYYPLASDTANVQINNALIPLAQGIDSNGAKNTILSKNETITGLTYTQGKNYLYRHDTGYGVKPYEPRYLKSELIRTFAGEQPDYYDVESNKWFNTDAGVELITNGTFDVDTSGWTVANGTFVVSNRSGLLTNSGGVFGQASQIITTVIGEKYRIKIDIGGTTANPTYLEINDKVISSRTSSYDTTFIATTTSTTVKITNNAQTNAYTYIDNVSCFKVSISPTIEITNSRNYLNHIVHADNDGGVLYVEELPKVEYKDVVKANEFKGKNACTALVNFDGTTTPPTIRDSYGFSICIKVAVGIYRLYFDRPMDNLNYGFVTQYKRMISWVDSGSDGYKDLNYITIQLLENGGNIASNDISVHVYGGRN